MQKLIIEKWQPILENEKMPPITDNYRKRVTSQLLQNQQDYLNENAPQSVAANAQNWDPILISLVRRLAPKFIAYDICGVQPMTGPTGLVFAMRSRYNNASGNEAFMNESDTSYSGTGTHKATVDGTGMSGVDPWDADFSTGTPKGTAAGEVDMWNSMSVTIERTSVTAKTRQLRADYSLELAQDLRVIHGLDAENELSNILSMEIISEINREVVRTIYSCAKIGAQFAPNPGTYDLAHDSDGRWFLERIKGLLFALERDANAIGHETRRGKR